MTNVCRVDVTPPVGADPTMVEAAVALFYQFALAIRPVLGFEFEVHLRAVPPGQADATIAGVNDLMPAARECVESLLGSAQQPGEVQE